MDDYVSGYMNSENDFRSLPDMKKEDVSRKVIGPDSVRSGSNHNISGFFRGFLYRFLMFR